MELSRMGQDVSSRISARLADGLATKIGYRADLHVSDFNVINKAAAKVLIGYSPKLGKPDGMALEQFVMKHFDGKIVADVRTARNIRSHNVVECVVLLPQQRLDISAKKSMTALAGNMMYLDHQLGNTWQVVNGDEGPCLVRTSKENIADLLMARHRAMRTHAGCVTFSEVGENEGVLVVAKDYKVSVWYDNKQVEGTVASVNEDSVRVRTKDGKVIACSRAAVLSVSEISLAQKEESIKALRDFYSQFYPKDIVDTLYPEKLGEPEDATEPKESAKP